MREEKLEEVKINKAINKMKKKRIAGIDGIPSRWRHGYTQKA